MVTLHRLLCFLITQALRDACSKHSIEDSKREVRTNPAPSLERISSHCLATASSDCFSTCTETKDSCLKHSLNFCFEKLHFAISKVTHFFKIKVYLIIHGVLASSYNHELVK